jgi:Putative beta-barrel porin 2
MRGIGMLALRYEFVIDMNKEPCKALSKRLSLVVIMPSQRFYGALVTLCFLLGCRLSFASVGQVPAATASPVTSGPPPASSSNTTYLMPVNPATINQADQPTPAVMALPANTPLPGDSSTTRKFYTLSASLREIYDDNVNTSSSNKQGSAETELSPSILVDFPTAGGGFSARYTFDITYYEHQPNNIGNAGNGGNGTSSSSSDPSGFEYSHEFVAQYTHAFSDRFNLNLAEQFRSYTEPSVDQNVGTAYQNGAYVSNVVNGNFSAQWTPLFGTTSTYSNTIIRYDQTAAATDQNNTENTGSQTFSFSILPKISLSFGGIGDDINYESGIRGYTTYTGFIGAQWQALPSISLTVRGGASYDKTVFGQSSISPYAAASLAWSLGARSKLSFDYAHEVTPSDQIGANGQNSDRFSAGFYYDITNRLSAHLAGSVTNAVVSDQLANTSSLSGYSEIQYYLDTGLTYHYNNYLDFDSGLTLSGVSSDISFNDYSRDEVYLGVRGTY